jgi:hypothetical protein
MPSCLSALFALLASLFGPSPPPPVPRTYPRARIARVLCDMDGGDRATVLAEISRYDRARARELYDAVVAYLES